ncbi:MAG: hypothetical protein K0S00_3417 [Xanthobacteraceae bacterium]|nr:hypothetical protein [Xanthobacteraceae bacterium]
MDSFDLPFERALEEIDKVNSLDELTPFIRELLEPYGLRNVESRSSPPCCSLAVLGQTRW